ncbi:hypothetical protein, partial [Stutzerimonas stutzeri]|uniref:hypothetical protein n=1 Tax=Stutzerimonas stutzeri TaxID=316 RepID=UPI003D26E996
ACASSTAWLLTCSMSRIGASTTEYTPQATVSLRAVAVLVNYTESGRSSLRASRERPATPILSLTPSTAT